MTNLNRSAGQNNQLFSKIYDLSWLLNFFKKRQRFHPNHSRALHLYIVKLQRKCFLRKNCTEFHFAGIAQYGRVPSARDVPRRPFPVHSRKGEASLSLLSFNAVKEKRRRKGSALERRGVARDWLHLMFT